MPNVTGAFFDQNPDVEVALEDSAEIVEEVERSVFADLSIAHSQATPEVEFLTLPLSGGQVVKILNYDASRTRVLLSVFSGTALVASSNVFGIYGGPNASMSTLLAKGAVPCTLLPSGNYGSLELKTQDEVWIFNTATAQEFLFMTIERYAGS